MRIIRKRCLGLDLHKKQITGHLRVHRGSDQEPETFDIRFGTMPEELLRLRDWIVDHQVSDVVMEATGVYWMHLYELIESVTTPAVVNAWHVKKVSGRKTDVSDAQWLSELHAHGLLRLSFVPPKEIRELRLLSRYRTRLVTQHTAVRNRTIKMLEVAGIKLSSVVSDSFGRTGRALLDALAEGAVSAAKIEQVAKGTLRNKTAELEAALGTPLSDSQRELLAMHLQLYDGIDAQLAEAEEKLRACAAPYAKAIEKLDAVPGINPLAAITVLAETGLDMSVYRDAHHLSSLAGLAPGNSVSADKRRRVAMPKGNRHLKRICVQIAWAASRKNGSFLRSRFQRLTFRIGRNKAIVATARHILIIVYHLLAGQESYKDLGPDVYDKRNKERSVKRYVQQLQKLGFSVALQPASA
jgi:transposase